MHGNRGQDGNGDAVSTENLESEAAGDIAAVDAAFKLLFGEGVPAHIAIARAGALLCTACKMTSDPVRAMEFAIDMIQRRLTAWREPPKDAS